MPGGNDSNSPKLNKVSDLKPSTIGPTPPAAAKDMSPEYSENKKARELAIHEFKGIPSVPGAKG